MGQDIGFYRFTGKGNQTKSSDDVPDDFTWRYIGRDRFVSLVWDVPHEARETRECGPKHFYGCTDVAVVRPTDFDLFHEKLKTDKYLARYEDAPVDLFIQMADWLEKHPDVYVEYS